MEALFSAGAIVLGLIGILVLFFVGAIAVDIVKEWLEDWGPLIFGVAGILGGLFAIGYGMANDSVGWCAFGMIVAIVAGIGVWAVWLER